MYTVTMYHIGIQEVLINLMVEKFIAHAECAWLRRAIKAIAADISMAIMLLISTIKFVTAVDSRPWMPMNRNTSSLDIIIKIYYNKYRK